MIVSAVVALQTRRAGSTVLRSLGACLPALAELD
jgi:hypothetical protein